MSWEEKNGFTIQVIDLDSDHEGHVHATLLKRNSTKKTNKALLYIHGFVDYFFQLHLADWANENGLNFYAIDLRKYGRSILPHQKPNMIRDLRTYFSEIDKAVDIIKNTDQNKTLIINGHSTGGLISSLYAHYNRDNDKVQALILNSPFFDFNKPKWFKKLILPIVAKIGLRFPKLPSPEGLKSGYVKSIHRDHFGEWDFDFDKKPLLGFKINFGWISSIYYAQRNLQKGLRNITCPVLVMHSSKSVVPGKYSKNMQTADSVLNKDDISKFATKLGSDVQIEEITDGMHDLILSKKDVRDRTFDIMTDFISKKT